MKKISRRNISARAFLNFGLAAALLLSGCARLEYVKVPTATQYDQWDDKKQQQADSMKGVRYYLPRPFLHLKQSTPVAQRTALISFVWDEAAKAYKLEGPEKLPTWVRKVAPQKISITQALAVSLAKGPAKRNGEEKGAIDGTSTNGTAPSTSASGPNAQKVERPPSEIHARTGFLNSSDPVTRLGSRFDVVYLPDFEEQFVIQAKIGLGTADIETQLRNGWAAEVFSQKVDNSNLIPYVINQFESASEAAANIFTTWAPVAAGLPPNLGLPKASGGEEGGVIGAETAALQNFLSQVILFKLAEVRIAQPGLYPILKPSEIRRLSKSAKVVLTVGMDPEAALDSFVETANMPWIRQDMAFIPCPPFTVIGFNTTSDVFIAPATDRVELGGEPPSPEDTGDKKTSGPTNTTGPKVDPVAKLKSAFFDAAARSKWGDAAALIDFASSTVTADAAGTAIKISAPTGATITQAQRPTLKAKILAFFDNPPADVGDAVVVTPNDANPSPQVTITIKEPAAELAKRLKK